jgi:hypothetical protein
MKAVLLDKGGTLDDDLPYDVEPGRITLCSGGRADRQPWDLA